MSDHRASDHIEVRGGAYHDSVTLLAVSRAVAAAPGVSTAQVAMASPLNLDVLRQMGFAAPDAAGANDLVVAVRLSPDADGDALEGALSALTDALRRPEPSGAAVEEAPRTTAVALRTAPADLVLVSVPGEHAAVEAWDALAAGASVMLFSDNVSLTSEVALKDEAARRGLLVMGPDCGTALVSGVALGFCNVVRPGPVSIVAASGTGAQQLMALLDAAGVGVRHCLGVGGRDLSEAVGGRSAHQAMQLLANDPGTEVVVMVSKPPDPVRLAGLEQETVALGLDVVWAPLGEGRQDLTAVAEQVCRRLGVPVPVWPHWRPAEPSASTRPASSRSDASSQPGSLLRGLFCGGTLCDEAMLIAAERLGRVDSNIPLRPQWRLGGQPETHAVPGPAQMTQTLLGAGHAMVDFGDDALTQGRAHPMIDPSLRLASLEAAAADPRVGVLLLDVVLGHGSHPDPAPELAAAIAAARLQAASDQAPGDGRELSVVVSLTGTRDDPQDRERQANGLCDAGAHVYLSNAQGTRAALALLAAGPTAEGVS